MFPQITTCSAVATLPPPRNRKLRRRSNNWNIYTFLSNTLEFSLPGQYNLEGRGKGVDREGEGREKREDENLHVCG